MTHSRKRYPRHCLAALIAENSYKKAQATLLGFNAEWNKLAKERKALIFRLPPEEELRYAQARFTARALRIAREMKEREK